MNGMNPRKRYLDYVKNGGKEPFISLQIGCGAGFDCKLAGKEWLTEGTLDDTLRAYEIVECEPFLNIGLPDFSSKVPELSWQSKTETQGEARIIHRWLDTPYKKLQFKLHEQRKLGVTPLSCPLTVEDDLDVVSWYAEQHLKGIPYLSELLGPTLENLQPHGPVSIQWNVQPFELFGLASTVDMVMLSLLKPEEYRKTCNDILSVNLELIREIFKAGADFIFLGGPGAEIASPKIYEDFLIPDSKVITKCVHESGGLVYSHICSPIEPFLSKGYYNLMGLDLFETLSPPPVGNVKDLSEARKILNPEMCTRGNIGLDVLLNGSREDVEQATAKILEATRGTKHIVAASDYLLYDIPLENVGTMVKTVREYGQ
jgi:hypothetical protein